MNQSSGVTSLQSQWSDFFIRLLPALALVAPLGWLLASFLEAANIGTLKGDLYWISSHEGFIMTLTAPFFAGTFIFMGRTVAKRFPKTGIAVTMMGLFGVGTLATISGFRLFATVFVEHGIETGAIWTAFNANSNWYLPFLFCQLSQFIAWILAGAMVLRSDFAPKWAGLALILGVFSLVAGQFFLYMTPIFWPLANALWSVGIWGLGRGKKE